MNKRKKNYKEALEIIQSGQEELALRPRPDMDGFIPCEEHQIQLEKYARRQKIEKENNRAVSEGKKLIDSPIQSSSLD